MIEKVFALSSQLTPSRIQRNSYFVWSIALILIGSRLAFHFFASPLPDEAYYWLWGQTLDWGYFDHPPLQAWLQSITSALLGTSRFALRSPTLMSSAIIVWVFIRIMILAQPQQQSALRFLTAVFACPLFFIFTTITFNDHLMLAALSVAGYWTYLEALDLRRTNSKPNGLRLLGIGLMIGLAGLTKFNAALFGLGLLAFIVIDAPSRKLLKSPYTYAALGIALLCLTPVFWWNIQHDAQTFVYNFDARFVPTETFKEWFGRSLALLLPFMVGLGPFLWLGQFKRLFIWTNDPNNRLEILGNLALATFWTSTTACLIVAQRVHVLAYWNLPALILLIPYLVLSLEKHWALISHLTIGAVVAILFTLNYSVFPLSAMAGKPDAESAIMYDWSEISEWVTETERTLTPDFVAASDYRSGSILSFWLDRSDIEVIATRLSQFTLWLDTEEREGQSALLLTSDWFPLDEIHASHFDSLDFVDEKRVELWGVPIASYSLYIAQGFH